MDSPTRILANCAGATGGNRKFKLGGGLIRLRLAAAVAMLKDRVYRSSGCGYLRVHFSRWRALQAVHINAGHHIKVALPGNDRGVGELLRARGQNGRDGGIRAATDLTAIDFIALQIGGRTRLPRDGHGVRGWWGRRGWRRRAAASRNQKQGSQQDQRACCSNIRKSCHKPFLEKQLATPEEPSILNIHVSLAQFTLDHVLVFSAVERGTLAVGLSEK